LQGVFPQALTELGWVEGETVHVEVHDAGGSIDNMRGVVEQLLKRQVSVLVAAGGTVTSQAVAATRDVPIVMSASGFDPVEAGWADSYARPGRNVTGLTLANDEAVGKQLELLKSAAPKTQHVGLLRSPESHANRSILERAQGFAKGLGLSTTVAFTGPRDDIDQMVAELKAKGVDALLAIADPGLDAVRLQIAAAATRHRLPTAGQLPFYASAGFLVTYSADLRLIHRRAATYVDRILRGDSPSELPIERPTKFSFTLNTNTARALDLTIPPSILALADEVIE
jgi:putative ABC transport system substrate-binding protein